MLLAAAPTRSGTGLVSHARTTPVTTRNTAETSKGGEHVFLAAIGAAIVVGVVAHEIKSWHKPRTHTLDGAAPTLVPDTWTTRGK